MKTPITFNNRMFKILISVVASIYITFHGREIRVLESLQKPLLYIAITVSFVITYIMVSIIDYTNRWLDKRYDWREETLKRSLAQLVMGISLPLMVDFVIISTYFYFLGTNVFDNGFLRHDFPVIVLFVVVVNMYYILVSIFAEKEYNSILDMQPKPTKNDSILDKNKVFLTIICPELKDSDISLTDDVFYFFRNDRHVFLVTTSGKEYPINCNLTSLTNQFPDSQFVRINRTVIINTKLIEGYSEGEKRDTLDLLLSDRCKDVLKHTLSDHFVVTKKYISAITRLF